jgi:hypothetical protein
MRKIVVLILLLSLTRLVLAQGDYNAGVLAGIKVGWNVIQALLQKDDATYQTAVESWNSLVRTTGDQTYILPEGNSIMNSTTQPLVLGGTDSQGRSWIKPYHSFDSSTIGGVGGDWKPSV